MLLGFMAAWIVAQNEYNVIVWLHLSIDEMKAISLPLLIFHLMWICHAPSCSPRPKVAAFQAAFDTCIVIRPAGDGRVRAYDNVLRSSSHNYAAETGLLASSLMS